MSYMRDVNGVRLDAHALAYPLVESGGVYPTRPVGLPPSYARFVGVDAPSTALTGDTWVPIPPTPREVIFDTDWYTDVDDVMAARILAFYHAIGYVKVIAATINVTGMPTVNVPSLDAFLRTEGIVVPIGQVSSTYSDLVSTGPFQANLNLLPHATWASIPTAAAVMRAALVGAAGKVDIHCQGYLSAMQELIASAADGISSLTGVQLINATVNRVIIPSGQYPSGSENDFTNGPKQIAAAASVINNWPTNFPTIPIIYSGYEVGSTVTSGTVLTSNEAATNDPLRQAMFDWGTTTGHPSWGPMAEHMACQSTDPTADGYTLVQGVNAVNATTGANTFTAGAGNQFYLVKSLADSAYAAKLDALYLPGAQVKPATGTQIWTGSRWVPVSPSDNAATYRPQLMAPALPQDLKLLAAWKATNVTGVSDGTKFSSWPSSIPGGSALAQATSGKQPVYTASAGGRPAITFAGAQWMECGSITPPTNQYTVYARVRWSVLPTSAQTVCAMDDGSGNRDFHLDGTTSSKAQAASFVGSVGNVDQAPGTLVAGQWHLLTMRQDTVHGLECLLDTFTDGSSAFGNPWTNHPAALHVGCATTASPSQPMTGDIAEVRVYSGRHNDLQVAIVAAQM